MSGLNISDTHTQMGQRLGDTHDFPLTSTALIIDILFLAYKQIIAAVPKLKLDQQSSKTGEDIGASSIT